MAPDQLEKFISLHPKQDGRVAVHVAGQPVLHVYSAGGGYVWEPNQSALALHIGTDGFDSIPSHEGPAHKDMHVAIAAGLGALHHTGVLDHITGVDSPAGLDDGQPSPDVAMESVTGVGPNDHVSDDATDGRGKRFDKFIRKKKHTAAHDDWYDEKNTMNKPGVYEVSKESKLTHIEVRPTSKTPKNLLGKIGVFGNKHDLSNDDHYNKALEDAHEYGKKNYAGEYDIEYKDGHSLITKGSLNKVRRNMKQKITEMTGRRFSYAKAEFQHWAKKKEAERKERAKTTFDLKYHSRFQGDKSQLPKPLNKQTSESMTKEPETTKDKEEIKLPKPVKGGKLHGEIPSGFKSDGKKMYGSMKEETVELDELSKNTTINYIKKANKSLDKETNTTSTTATKREDGLRRATDSINKKGGLNTIDRLRHGIKKGSIVGVKEETEKQTHIVNVTVSDPNHTSVTARKEQIMKRIRVKAINRESAVHTAIHHYKKQGYKVHDHDYVGLKEETEQVIEAKRERVKHELIVGQKVIHKDYGHGTIDDVTHDPDAPAQKMFAVTFKKGHSALVYPEHLKIKSIAGDLREEADDQIDEAMKPYISGDHASGWSILDGKGKTVKTFHHKDYADHPIADKKKAAYSDAKSYLEKHFRKLSEEGPVTVGAEGPGTDPVSKTDKIARADYKLGASGRKIRKFVTIKTEQK